jgi:hypothetical protein
MNPTIDATERMPPPKAIETMPPMIAKGRVSIIISIAGIDLPAKHIKTAITTSAKVPNTSKFWVVLDFHPYFIFSRQAEY